MNNAVTSSGVPFHEESAASLSADLQNFLSSSQLSISESDSELD
jgi:hypothetical protein